MTALCEMATVEGVRIHIKATETFSLNPEADLMEIQLFSKSGVLLGKIKELLFAKWNDGELPIEPGTHESVAFAPNPVKFTYSTRWIECDVFAHITVGKLRYSGELNDEQVAMLTGEGPEVEMPDIETDWRKLEADEEVDADVTFEGVTTY